MEQAQVFIDFGPEKTRALSKVDLSRKGSVDEPIADLVDYLNSLEDFYTTSSCSGRLCVLQEVGCTITNPYTFTLPHRWEEIQDCIMWANIMIANASGRCMLHVQSLSPFTRPVKMTVNSYHFAQCFHSKSLGFVIHIQSTSVVFKFLWFVQ